MSLGFSLLLGLIQGLTEFLPVSSSGHLALVQILSGVDLEHGFIFFDLLLHLGTLISVFVAFFPDIRALILAFFAMVRDGFRLHRDADRKFILLLVIAVLPMFLLVPIKDSIERLFSSTRVVGVSLLVTAALLFLCDRMPEGRKTAKNATPLDALIVGFIQCIAVIPGISRSGSTISGGVFRGFSRDFAVRFAFILSIPTILGANLLSVPDAVAAMGDTSMLPVYFAGMAVAAVSGLLAIRLTRLLVARRGFTVFSAYCAVLGVIVLILSR